MAVFTAMVGENETLNLIISASIQYGNKMSGNQVPTEKIEKVRPIAILGGIMITISVVGIIMAVCVKLTMNKICVALEVVVLLTISIVLIVFGSLLVVPALYGTDYINDNCLYGEKG